MKASAIASIAAVGMATFIGLIIEDQNVLSQTKLSAGSSILFSCKVSGGTPSTVARLSIPKDTTSKPINHSSRVGTAKPQTIPIITWKRRYYSETKETPMERCIRVSGLIQDYNQKGALRYITTGNMDGKPVVCATKSATSPCSLLIFTLDKDENPRELIQDLRIILQNPAILTSSNPENTSSEESKAAQRWQGNGTRRRRPGRSTAAGTR